MSPEREMEYQAELDTIQGAPANMNEIRERLGFIESRVNCTHDMVATLLEAMGIEVTEVAEDGH